MESNNSQQKLERLKKIKQERENAKDIFDKKSIIWMARKRKETYEMTGEEIVRELFEEDFDIAEVEREIMAVEDELVEGKSYAEVVEMSFNEMNQELQNKIEEAKKKMEDEIKRSNDMTGMELLQDIFSEDELSEILGKMNLQNKQDTPKTSDQTIQGYVKNAINSGVTTEQVQNSDKIEQKAKDEKEGEARND